MMGLAATASAACAVASAAALAPFAAAAASSSSRAPPPPRPPSIAGSILMPGLPPEVAAGSAAHLAELDRRGARRRRLQEQEEEEALPRLRGIPLEEDRKQSHRRREQTTFESSCSGADWNFTDNFLLRTQLEANADINGTFKGTGRCIDGWIDQQGGEFNNWYYYPEDFKDAAGAYLLNDVRIYKCPDPQTNKRILLSNGVPDHAAQQGNPHTICEYHRKVTLPLTPTISAPREPANFGTVATALNGVPIYGALELNGGNAVEPPDAGVEGAVSDAQYWYGHATAIRQDHYHDPWAGGGQPGQDTLIGYAMDGVPLYGPLEDAWLAEQGNKTVDDVLDECNGRYVNGKYRYHTRNKDDVDSTKPYCVDEGNSPVLNWKYIVGCFKGPVDQTTVEYWDPSTFDAAADLPSDCFLEYKSDLTPPGPGRARRTRRAAAAANVGRAGGDKLPAAGRRQQQEEGPEDKQRGAGAEAEDHQQGAKAEAKAEKTAGARRQNKKRRAAYRTGAPRPNFLIIQPDDLQFYNEWGPPPNSQQTDLFQESEYLPDYGLPNIEKLRARSVRMRQAHTASPTCGTSRYSTLTGRYASRSATNRDRSYRAQVADVNIPRTKLEDVLKSTEGLQSDSLDCSQDNLAQALRANGYRTGMTGKWHLQSTDQTNYDYADATSRIKDCGFDYVDGMFSENLVEHFTDNRFTHNMEWMTDHAIKFIHGDYDSMPPEDADKPWMLYYNPTVPHMAADIAEAIDTFTCRETPDVTNPLPRDPLVKGMTMGLTIEFQMKSGRNVTKEVESGSCELYRASIKERAEAKDATKVKAHKLFGAIWLDDAIGALMTALRDSGQVKNTMIVFQMDHGLTEKLTLFEGGNRIAQFVHYPDAFGTDGRDFHGLVSTIDVAATALDYAGVTDPYDMDGESWRGVIGRQAKETKWEEDRCLFFEADKDRALRCGQCDKYMEIKVNANETDNGHTYRVGKAYGLEVERSLYFDLCELQGGTNTTMATRQYVSWPDASVETTHQNFLFYRPKLVTVLRKIMQCHKDNTSPQNGVDMDYNVDCNYYAGWDKKTENVCGDLGVVPHDINTDGLPTIYKTCNWVVNNNLCGRYVYYCEESCGQCTSQSHEELVGTWHDP